MTFEQKKLTLQGALTTAIGVLAVILWWVTQSWAMHVDNAIMKLQIVDMERAATIGRIEASMDEMKKADTELRSDLRRIDLKIDRVLEVVSARK